MCKRFFRFTVAALLAGMAGITSLQAQIGLDDDSEGVRYSILPTFGFSSDVGLYGGGILERTDYGIGIRPFSNQSSFEVTASTEGNFAGSVGHERMRSFGADIRSRFRMEAARLVNKPFFAIGNDSDFSNTAYEAGDYYYKDRSARFDFQARRELTIYGSEGKIDGQFLTSVSFSRPASIGSDTVFGESRPTGSRGGWVNMAGLGMIVDHRVGDVDPSEGYRFEWKVETAGSLTASDFTFTRMTAEASGYYSPFRNLVIAQKLQYLRARGDTPFWELPMLGHEEGLRGYVSNRFRDDNSILHILELRMWLLEFMDEKIRLGLHGFMDTGRVFPKGESISSLVSGLKQTFGVGGAVSILNPDFILRGEVAFSEEISRLYFGIGYVF